MWVTINFLTARVALELIIIRFLLKHKLNKIFCLTTSESSKSKI